MIVTVSAWTRALFLGLVLALSAGQACAGDVPVRGAEPDWVVAAADDEETSSITTSEGMQVLLFDTQFRADPGVESFYMRVRNKALSAQALPILGNLAVTWSPASQDVIIHHVEIIRDGQTIDVLADQSFETLRREQNLEQAMLDGQLTAVLQPAGLRVGDILDTAYTVVARDPVTAGHAEQALDLNLPVVVDRIRYRASWPSDRPVRLRAADGWTPLTVQRRGGYSSVEVALDAPQPVAVPGDVPVRMRAVRRIELSDYRDWSEIAVLLKPLYDAARGLEPDSPLKAEIERIRALSDDPAVRVAAALRLVQDEVRYVALLMGDGALTPASADETWRRRLGDCKAKTALLLALLDGLGIKAAPAAVSIDGGDGLNERLPMITAFNHVLVRAEVNGTTYWLDGARTGDRELSGVPMPAYHWALPLTGADATLEALIVPPLALPTSEAVVLMDASAGLQAPAAVTGNLTFRGDAASLLGGQLALLSEAQRDQAVRGLWMSQLRDLTVTEADFAYDVEANVLNFSVEGTIVLTWGADGLIPPGASYSPMATLERQEGPFRNSPYAVNHPSSSRSEITVKLPQGGQGFRTSGGEVDRTELGHHLRRHMRLDGDTVVIEVTMISLTDEITAEEADRVRTEEEARSWNPPRIFAPEAYRTTEADRAAMTADTPTTADGWLDRAFALSSTGDYAAAAEAADHAVALDPESSNAWANRGLYRLRTGDRENAVIDLEKAVDLDPSERIAMNGNAMIAMMDRRYQDAVVEISRALRQAPGDSFALALRAQAYIELRQFDRALRDIDAIIAGQPDEPGLKRGRVAVLLQAGRNEDAEREIDALAEAEPESPELLLLQATTKVEVGKAEAALEIANRLLPLSEQNPDDVRLVRAAALAQLGRLDEMAADMAAVREFSSESAGRLNNLCWLAAEYDVLLDQAMADCDAALDILPGDAAILDSRGFVLLQRGDVDGALANYQAALAAEPDLAASLFGRGLARIAQGQIEGGEADKAAAVELDPEIAHTFRNYAPLGVPQTP